MSFRKGIVVAVHPEDHSVDILMADDGSRLTGVQVMTPNGSTRTGSVDLPSIPDKEDKWDVSEPTGQDLHAIVGYVGRHPVVTGFLYPQVNQMTHTDGKLRMDRHQSDVMTTIDGEGNIQLSHPSGLFLKIGSAPEKTDYAGKNADGNSSVDRNTSTTPYVRLHMAGGKAVLTIAPDGAVSLTTETTIDAEAQGDVNVTTHANATVTAQGSATVTAGDSVTVDTPTTTITGNATVDGNLTVKGSTSVKAISSNGKNISNTHTHNNVTPGPAPTGTVT